MTNAAPTQPDEAASKGAVEEASPNPAGNPDRPAADTLATQLGHRDQDEMLKDSDTDFPEPAAEGEHSGE